MSKSFLIVETKDHVRKITFNNPKKKNAFNGDAYVELANCLNEASRDDSVSESLTLNPVSQS